MKKLLLFLALAAAGLQGWARDLYIVGDATLLTDAGNSGNTGWAVGSGNRTLTHMTENSSTFTWRGLLKFGYFKICEGESGWNGYHPETADQVIYADGNAQTMTTDNGKDYKWKIVIPGIYCVTVNTSDNTISITPDWHDISTGDELIAFAEYVNAADESNFQGGRWARLTADIDMNGKTFPGIGRDSKWKRYHGTLDGQGHKISNLNMTSEHCALVTVAGGGCVVKNILIDNTCEFNGTGRNAAFISCNNYTDFGNTINIENCGNEANVTGTNNNCAGIHGCNYSGSTHVTIKNCFNTGNISSTGNESAPISGWLGSSAWVENTWNIGSINNEHSNNSFARWNNGTYVNCFSTLSWGNTIEGKTLGYDAANVSSGLLCFTLNGNVSGGEVWKQTLPSSSGDSHPYPGVFAGHSLVYANGDLHCDGTAKGTVTYSNTEGENRDAHDYADGFCSYCHILDASYLTPVDGYFEIGNMHNLHWFSQYVNSGNPTANAKLTADIEQATENEYDYTPIGSATHPYTGTFDGQTHSVTLRINNTAYNYQGLFGIVTDGVKIEKVIVKGYVKGNNYVGGIVGGTNGGTSNAKKTNIWYCGNEATITANGGNAAGIIGVNMSGEASVILTNCYNTGNVTGGYDSGAISGWLGGGWSSVRNCYNSGTVKNGETSSTAFGRNNGCHFTNCYYTQSSGTSTDGNPTEVADADVASGLLCAKLGYGFRQNLGTDTEPNFNVDHGFVSQISDAGYSTMFNIHSDVTIPSGVEAYAGVVNTTAGTISLNAITGKVAKDEPVVLKGAAGLYNFMPTTGAGSAETNDLKGSSGNTTGAAGNIYALAKPTSSDVGFYLVGSSVTIPEGRAYLEYTASDPSSPGEVKGFTFVFDDDATAIEMVNGQSSMVNEIYNLAGQRINKMQKGINIVNGKKILK